jgi:hypothetical protein
MRGPRETGRAIGLRAVPSPGPAHDDRAAWRAETDDRSRGPPEEKSSAGPTFGASAQRSPITSAAMTVMSCHATSPLHVRQQPGGKEVPS